ncbi:MAG: hypothetical protein K0S33_4042 [Bacteroidetes bacterium]|jgi:hypothetical protein|nr:hypothetical protein [Bacteroidota bacterium]
MIRNCILLLGFFAAIHSGSAQKASNNAPVRLKGTHWSSDFFHYHNDYFFVSDSSGYSLNGQWSWSLPDDSAVVNQKDSIIYDKKKDTFRYMLKGNVLSICYYPDDGKGDVDCSKVFHLRKQNKRISFVSDYEYVYGKEVLYKEVK